MTDQLTLRVADVARVLSVPQSTVYLWIQRQRLPAVRVERVLLIRRKDLDDFLESHLITKGDRR